MTRSASRSRTTKETSVAIAIDLDGTMYGISNNNGLDNALVTRDLDLLAPLAQQRLATVDVSVTPLAAATP